MSIIDKNQKYQKGISLSEREMEDVMKFHFDLILKI
jgi:hypothetical protein